MISGGTKYVMRDFGEYLRAYWVYVSTSLAIIVKWHGVNTDIEDRKRVEEDLRRSEAYLAKGQEASLPGTFVFYSATGEFTWSEQLYRIYEFEPWVRPTFELIAMRYHPQDKHVIDGVAEQVHSGVAKFDYSHRLLMPDGSIKYIHVVAHGGQAGQAGGSSISVRCRM